MKEYAELHHQIYIFLVHEEVNMKIVSLKRSHVDDAARVMAEAYNISYRLAKKEITSKERKEEWMVAIIDCKVAGFMGYFFDHSHYANFLEDIAVSKEHRHKGVATALLKKFVEISRKSQPKKQPYCLSSTKISNKASIRLHLGFGFRKLGTLKKLHYGQDEIFFGYKMW